MSPPTVLPLAILKGRLDQQLATRGTIADVTSRARIRNVTENEVTQQPTLGGTMNRNGSMKKLGIVMKRLGIVLTMTVCLSLSFAGSAHAQNASFFAGGLPWSSNMSRSEEHTSELQSLR